MEKTFQKAASLLEAGEEFVLAAVISSDGSTPRHSGAKMLVLPGGSVIATIGGGALEAAAIERALSMTPGGAMEIMDFDLSQKDVNNLEAICGGKERVLLCRITTADLPVFRAVTLAAAERRRASFVILKDKGSEGVFCVEEDGSIISASPPDAGTQKVIREAASGPSIHSEAGGSESTLYIEQISFDGTVYFFGGGHVALATARAAEIAGFDTAVLEERAEFISAERFPNSRTILLDSFYNIPDLSITRDDYIVIVTRGHSFDRVCLAWALKTDAGYIGMIGSKTKRDLVYAQLEKDGFSRRELEAVRCPIGLPLGGPTPGEIAVSIVAELITVRSKKTDR